MEPNLVGEIEALLDHIEPDKLFAICDSFTECSVITGLDEIIVTAGEAQHIEINNGLRSLNPTDHKSYDPNLVDEIKNEHCLIGTIPFDPGEKFKLSVPRIAFILQKGGFYTISSDSLDDPRTTQILTTLKHKLIANEGRPANPEPFNDIQISDIETDASFTERVSNAIQTIQTSSLNKVVLSKAVRITTQIELDNLSVFKKMSSSYPDAYLFSVDKYVGASPELVTQLSGKAFTSHPLAGTAPHENASNLLLSTKDLAEHKYVVNQILEDLSKLGIYTKKQSSPSITTYGPLVHLGTEITGDLEGTATYTSLEIVAAIAPTAAICGDPYGLALGYINHHELDTRGAYGGLVGYQKRNGDGCWLLNIRSVELTSTGAVIRAGVGLIDQSSPPEENDEANSKLNSIISGISGS